jgi:hypothetical protein
MALAGPHLEDSEILAEGGTTDTNLLGPERS